jgi:hypothetical protein
VPNIKWIERERYHLDVEAAGMLATAKSWNGWDWAVVCGGQREGTDVRNMMCISHPSCPRAWASPGKQSGQSGSFKQRG